MCSLPACLDVGPTATGLPCVQLAGPQKIHVFHLETSWPSSPLLVYLMLSLFIHFIIFRV